MKNSNSSAKVKHQKQLTIYDAVGDSNAPSPTELGDTEIGDSNIPSPTELGDAKKRAIQRYLDRGKIEPSAHISKYRPNGRKTEYYRLDYRHPVTKKPRSIHIPGGNIRARLVQVRVKKIQAIIDRGGELSEIIAAVQDYRA